LTTGLPRVSGRDAVAVFERAGFVVRRQRGSHIVMTKSGHQASLSIPDYQELHAGTLRALIRKAAMTVEQFNLLLRA